ncbi:hypothetical protein AeMF1_009765 [Aphanomyces euteiches]|nr:hypothetical protein AeMF1_009765 [Aphanomyces euteiches]KAH9187001.1 hypothetical protein AeNC1_011022 [Aphanomyces euteiches]
MTVEDKRPNTAGHGVRQAASRRETPSKASSVTRRPGSADTSFSFLDGDDSSTKAAPRMTITDIVNRNQRKTSSSADLIKEFEHAIQKVVDGKRSESDKLQFVANKKAQELDKLKLTLQDLTADCVALGMHEYPDPNDRLEPIASVSRRPVYAKKTNIRELEQLLRLKAVETANVVRKCLTYEHIKKRHEMEKLELTHATNHLNAVLRDKQHELQELHRVEMSANESLNQVQTKLMELKQSIAADIRMYETELELRLRWAKERAKFDAFYEQQILALPSVVDGAVLREDKSTYKLEIVDSSPSMDHWSVHMTPAQVQAVREDEKLHEDAFRRLGLPRGVVDAKQIIDMCMTHESLERELEQRHAEQLQLIEATHMRIKQVKSEVHDAQDAAAAVTRTKSTDLEMQDAQMELAIAEKKLMKAREEFEYTQQVIQPVKAGIQQIVSQVIGTTIDVDNVQAIEHALDAVEKELLNVLPDLTRHSPEEGSGGMDSDKRSKLQGLAITTLNPKDITSPFNIRIRPKEPPCKSRGDAAAAAAMIPSKLSPGDGKKQHRPPPPLLLGEENGAVDAQVMDRETVKQISATLTTQQSKKKQEENQLG